MVDIKIYLNPSDDGRRIYEPNETLTGTAELILRNPKPISAFYLLFTGISKCGWSENQEDSRTGSATIRYSGKMTHLQKKVFLYGAAGANPVNFDAGNYKYDFECPLPDDIPSSFSGTFGSIEYKVKAYLIVPWTWAADVFEVFTVKRHDNLNDFSSVRKPQRASKVEDFFSLLMFEKGKCYLTASIPFSGFIPGGSIPITISYVNESNVEVESTKIYLVYRLSFESSSPETRYKIGKEVLVQKETQGVAEHSKKEFEYILNLPRHLNFSNSKFTKVVMISYHLLIEGVVNSWHESPKVELPIVIGAVAIGDTSYTPRFTNNNSQKDVQRPTAPASSTFYPPSAPTSSNNLTSVPAPSAPVFDDLPPSFEEAMGLKESDSVGWKLN